MLAFVQECPLLETWLSGLKRHRAKVLREQSLREFESHRLRQFDFRAIISPVLFTNFTIMDQLNPRRTALALGSFVAFWHLVWVILLGIGWAKPLMDLNLQLH